MGHSPYYPDDVTDEMIDEYFGANDNSCCKYCRHFSDNSCKLMEDALEEDILAGNVEDMPPAEFYERTKVEDDDYCDDYEWNDNLEEEPYDMEVPYDEY